MALISTKRIVTIPETSYEEQIEDRCSRIVITTPKSDDESNPTKFYMVETARTITEYRNGTAHTARVAVFNPTMAQILAHPNGPAVMAGITKILEDLYASANPS